MKEQTRRELNNSRIAILDELTAIARHRVTASKNPLPFYAKRLSLEHISAPHVFLGFPEYRAYLIADTCLSLHHTLWFNECLRRKKAEKPVPRESISGEWFKLKQNHFQDIVMLDFEELVKPDHIKMLRFLKIEGFLVVNAQLWPFSILGQPIKQEVA